MYHSCISTILQEYYSILALWSVTYHSNCHCCWRNHDAKLCKLQVFSKPYLYFDCSYLPLLTGIQSLFMCCLSWRLWYEHCLPSSMQSESRVYSAFNSRLNCQLGPLLDVLVLFSINLRPSKSGEGPSNLDWSQFLIHLNEIIFRILI